MSTVQDTLERPPEQSAEGERRARQDRRRSSKGLLELRARRDGVTDDRRSVQQRRRMQSWLQRFPPFTWLARRTKTSS